MPLFASIWLTLLPAEPQAPVAIRVTSPDLEGWSREHTFEPGVRVAGSIPLSSGSYRLTALDGACAIDLRIGGEREADVLLRLTDASDCELVQTGEHGQSAGTHREPAVLIAPDSVPATESP